MNWYFDTSVIVPAALGSHPHNSPALSVLQALVEGNHRGFMGAHSLTEVYSVLTRTPFNPPFHPSEVWHIIETMILPHMELLALTPIEYQEVVRECSIRIWKGGRVHDAVHLRCAQNAGCDRIYTFNVRDLRSLAPPELLSRIAAP